MSLLLIITVMGEEKIREYPHKSTVLYVSGIEEQMKDNQSTDAEETECVFQYSYLSSALLTIEPKQEARICKQVLALANWTVWVTLIIMPTTLSG